MESRAYGKFSPVRVVWLVLLVVAGAIPVLALLAWLTLSTAPAASAAPLAPSGPASAGDVTITGTTFPSFAFSPSVITVTAGSVVTWTNDSITTHTSTSDSSGPGAWDSSGILVGGVFTHTFMIAGTFGYHCAIHPSMTGTVVVLPLPPKAYLPAVLKP